MNNILLPSHINFHSIRKIIKYTKTNGSGDYYTSAGKGTRLRALVAIGGSNGHIGLGVKCSKEVATARYSWRCHLS